MKLHRPFIVNIHILTRTNKEWREDNKIHIKDANKKYYEENKEQIIEQHKQYRAENIIKIKEERKKHYNENKAAISAKDKKYKSKTSFCEPCGKDITNNNYYAHIKTNKHLENSDKIKG